MTKVIFAPFSILAGLIAGFTAKKLFEQIWGLIDDREPPDSSIRRTTWTKVLLAGAVEGAIFKATRSLVDRGARTTFHRITGAWPGDEEAELE
jgi:Protein of unknown function (DUF4235)